MSLLNPLFLLGLAAVAAPILVHLIRWTRAPRVEFASLMFVRRIPQRTIRRKRLHNLLLLLMRCLALLLVVMAFARPYFSRGEKAAGSGDLANVLLIDNSFSMRYGQRFEQAKARAKAMVGEMRGSERTALLSFGQGYDILSRFTPETGRLTALIDSLQPGLGSTDYVQALRGAERLFEEAGPGDRRIFLISDFQAAGRNPAEATFRLAKNIKLVPVDVGEGAAPNLAVTEVGAQPMIYQQKYTDKLTARIANLSDEPREAVRVEFQINEHVVERRELRLGPQESQVIDFTGFNLSEGDNRCLVQVSGDDFPLDNRFYFTLRRGAQLRALAIETAVRGRSESFYLRNALTTGENLPFALTVKTAGSVNPAELADYRVVILNDPGEVSPALSTRLAKFVEQGGGLVISAGPHTQAESFNQSFPALAPAELGEAVQLRGDYVALSEIKTDHPIFEVFRQSGRLASVRVFGYHRSTPREGAAVLARFEDGSPALVESATGGGKVLLYTSTLDAGWNDLPLTPIYLPLIRQMARYLGEREERAWNPIGQAFTVPVAKDGMPPAVDAPSGERLTERQQTATGELIVNARAPGFYRLRYPDRSEFAAVNLDPKESDLRRLEVDEFVAAVTGADPKATPASAQEPKLTGEEIEARQRVWWGLLLAALALFVAEAILARRTKMARVLG